MRLPRGRYRGDCVLEQRAAGIRLFEAQGRDQYASASMVHVMDAPK
jgi:hypothetical protein